MGKSRYNVLVQFDDLVLRALTGECRNHHTAWVGEVLLENLNTGSRTPMGRFSVVTIESEAAARAGVLQHIDQKYSVISTAIDVLFEDASAVEPMLRRPFSEALGASSIGSLVPGGLFAHVNHITLQDRFQDKGYEAAALWVILSRALPGCAFTMINTVPLLSSGLSKERFEEHLDGLARSCDVLSRAGSAMGFSLVEGTTWMVGQQAKLVQPNCNFPVPCRRPPKPDAKEMIANLHLLGISQSSFGRF